MTTVDGGSPSLPRYAQIQHFIRAEVAAGRLKDGERIPTELELSERFNAARATVARAIQQLVFEGLIVRKAGSGSFVSMRAISEPLQLPQVSSFDDTVSASGATVSYELLAFSSQRLNAEASALLEAPLGEKAFLLQRLRLVGGVRTSLEVRYLPFDIGCRLSAEMLHGQSIHHILRDLGTPVCKVVGKIRACIADAALAEKLDVALGSPLLIRDYVLRSANDVPLACGESFYRPEYHIDYVVTQA